MIQKFSKKLEFSEKYSEFFEYVKFFFLKKFFENSQIIIQKNVRIVTKNELLTFPIKKAKKQKSREYLTKFTYVFKKCKPILNTENYHNWAEIHCQICAQIKQKKRGKK